MAKPRHSTFRVRDLVAVLGLVGFAISLLGRLARYFQPPDLIYFTKEVPDYLMAYQYQDDRLFPAEMEGRLLKGGPFKLLNVVLASCWAH